MKTAALALILTSVLTGRGEKQYVSQWHEHGADFFNSPAAAFQYSEKGRFYYCISNDSSNIFVDIRIFDPDVQRHVNRSGMTIWVNTEGKKKKKAGITWPYRHARTEEERFNERAERSGIRSERITDTRPAQIRITGFSGGAATEVISPIEKDNVRGSIRMGPEKNMYYEVIIPIERLRNLGGRAADPNNGNLVLGFSQNDSGQGMERQGRGEGGPGIGGGGIYGGGMRGGMRGYGGMQGYRGGRQFTPVASTVWIKNIRLAHK